MMIRLLKLASLIVLGLVMQHAYAAQQAVILQYHHVDTGTPASTSISPELFDEHIRFIQNNGYTVWPLDDAVDAVRNDKPLPDKAVVITVDDAYRSVYTEIYPRMKKLGWSFTVFVNSDAHDRKLGHYISWDQMREMKKQGAIFANHTNSHLHLLRKQPGEDEVQWLTRVRQDIEYGQRRLIEELGEAPMLFAYPYGEHNPQLRKLVTDLGYVGFGQQSGPIGPRSDYSMLPRFPMAAGFAGMRRFPEKLNTLPLPVIAVEPEDPVLSEGDSLPVLRLTLADGSYRRSAISCYLTGQGKGQLAWQGDTLRVIPNRALPVGRSRYNCTAPNTRGSGYYWYSHAWFKKKPDGSWYSE
jgi:peptidoglycan/xylan/chitin deacetylase (PgdA/CDA1 family)